jgi:two-component system response regulator RegX3
LLARIGAVLHRYRRISDNQNSTVITVGDTSLDLGKLQFIAPDRRPVLLTPTEMKLLECLMRNANVVVSRDTLIAHTHGDFSAGGSNRTDVYVRRLRKKIEVHPNDRSFIHTVRGVGYVFRYAQLAKQSTG